MRRFTAIMATESRGGINRGCNSERLLVFAHILLTKTLGVHRAREVNSRISKRMDLWERGLHAVLVGDADAEGAAREGRSARGREEEEESLSCKLQSTVLSGKIFEAVCWATNK